MRPAFGCLENFSRCKALSQCDTDARHTPLQRIFRLVLSIWFLQQVDETAWVHGCLATAAASCSTCRTRLAVWSHVNCLARMSPWSDSA
jgi:hypothetical protein